MNANDQEGLFQSVDQIPAKITQPQENPRLEDLDQERVKITDLHPIEEKNIKPSDLQFDIKLGWMPRAQISGPIPLAYAHPDMDDLINENLGSMLYLGYRPTNSFDIHKCFYDSGKKYPFNQFHLCKSKFLESFFRKYYSDFEFHSPRKQGMLFDDCELTFDSFFEGGNLDAVYFHQEQYRLILRVDTNTRGHCNYYRFKIKNKAPGRYKFRIMNMSKAKSLYQRGKCPYIRTKKNNVWRQGGQKVRYGLSPLFQEYQLTRKIYSLKFQYEFTQANDEVQFCYGIPFVYSELLTTLESYRSHPHFYLNKLCYSLSGIEVPLITITENEESSDESKNKSVIVIIGRAHPGETHGSHIINGLIKTLLQNKPQSNILRKNLIVKIVPMINPDGVIIGNTRTSLTGKDLNRVYSNRTDFVFPQIIGIRDFTKKLKQKYGKRLLFLIDVHGHSTRKNSFFFGPQYPVFDEQYNKCRMLARIFAAKTQIFRYYSCKFRLSSFKEKTCRGFFNSKDIVRTYTHQTSMHSYFDFDARKDKVFDKNELESLGQKLFYSIHDYLIISLKIKEIPVPEPVNKKKKQRKNQILEEQEEEDSDQMGSDKADSEESDDDFGTNQMKMFWNRINENKQYFYEQLCTLNKVAKPQPLKKHKKQRYDSSDEQNAPKKVTASIINPVLENLKGQTEVKKKKQEWVPKLDFSQKKRNFQEYDKVSSVVFGGTISLFNEKKNQFLYSKTKLNQNAVNVNNINIPEARTTKYSFLNVNVNTGDMKDYRSTKANKFIQNKTARTSLKIYEKRQSNYGSISPSQLVTQKPKLIGSEGIKKFVGDPKPLNLLSATNYKVEYHSESKAGKTSFQTTSLKFLPRKKSIKNIRDEDKYVQKKIAKNLRQEGLPKKLPSLNKLYNS